MSYLIPVSRDLEEARIIARSKGGEWLIRKCSAGLYYVVPKDDRGFDGLGSLIEIVNASKSKTLNDWPNFGEFDYSFFSQLKSVPSSFT